MSEPKLYNRPSPLPPFSQRVPSAPISTLSNAPHDYQFPLPGALLLDGIAHSFCLGFVFALGLKYWEDFGDEVARKRVYVLALVLLSTLQTILQDYKLWTVAVSHEPWAGSSFVWVDFFLNGMICCLCEVFYIKRCWKTVNYSPWVLYPLSVLWISGVGAQLYISITLGLEFPYAKNQQLDERLENMFRDTLTVFSYWVIVSAVLDLSFAVILTSFLRKTSTDLENSTTVIHRVIFMALETAVLPFLSMLAAAITAHADPEVGHHDDLLLFFVFITAKFQTIGLLRTLNSRVPWRDRIDATDMGRTELGGRLGAERKKLRGLDLATELLEPALNDIGNFLPERTIEPPVNCTCGADPKRYAAIRPGQMVLCGEKTEDQFVSRRRLGG